MVGPASRMTSPSPKRRWRTGLASVTPDEVVEAVESLRAAGRDVPRGAAARA